MKQFLKKFHIQNRISTPYYPQSNGQVEASNKTIEQILHSIIIKHGKDWHTQLVYALWAYRMSVCMTTGTTPCNLIYGTNAIMPIELEIPSLRVSLKGLIDDYSYHIVCLNQIELIDEHHFKALKHLQAYQKYLSK